MTSEFVERRGGVYVIPGTRVPVSSIIYAFTAGQTPESIANSFQVLTLEQVNGAIDFYLAHREEMDRNLEDQRQDVDSKRNPERPADQKLHVERADPTKKPLPR